MNVSLNEGSDFYLAQIWGSACSASRPKYPDRGRTSRHSGWHSHLDTLLQPDRGKHRLDINILGLLADYWSYCELTFHERFDLFWQTVKIYLLYWVLTKSYQQKRVHVYWWQMEDKRVVSRSMYWGQRSPRFVAPPCHPLHPQPPPPPRNLSIKFSTQILV